MRLNNFLISEGINDKGIFKACFMCGHPGAGKSYTLTKIKSGSIEPRIVNTDKAFPLFKEYWNDQWGKIATKVKTINKNQLAGYVNSILPLAVDGTANNPSAVLKRVGILESFGYDVGMVFVNTSLETAIERASKRERHVDVDFIEKVYKQVTKAKTFYRGKFQTWVEVDNDDGELTNDVITHAFKFMSSFYNSSINNPIGQEHKETMIRNGWKYLSPEIMELNQIKKGLSGWYI